ncbi:MAG: nitroreductase family protein [Clostridia bacterium]|nr:nitroreductase family protein [Clostridia bacterium]
MNVLDAIRDRTSYRGTFQNTAVAREHLIRIMEAGLAAPSGCNKQTASLIAVDDAQALRKLHKVIQKPAVETAPAMICVLTQRIIAYRDRCFHVHDYSAAIENMLLAIVGLGYQSCWYEGYITDTDAIGRKMADVLGVPADYALVCFLPIGIAAEPVTHAEKKPFAERAWFNGFRKD